MVSEGQNSKMCHCGQPLHYTNPETEAQVERMISIAGGDENVRVGWGGRTWKVQRHYIALHGLKGSDLPGLGFEEVTGRS